MYSSDADPHVKLIHLLRHAHSANASRLLLLAGQTPVMRKGGQLSPPLDSDALHFRETQIFAESLLNPAELSSLDKDGSVETDILLDGIPAKLNVFYGAGCHNLIFHFTET